MSLSKIVQESVSEMNSAIEQDFMFFNNNNPIEDSEWSLKDENREYLYKIVEKTKDELEERQKKYNSYVKNHLISSQISLLEAELERKEKTRRDENFYLRDAVSIVEEDISYLQDQITKCKELMK